MKSISVILADDDQLILDDLKTLINWEKLGFLLTATANNGDQALRLVKKYRPQILITDVIMPGMNGVELVEKLKDIQPDLKILMISSYDEFDYVKKAISLGVYDYLLKNEITASTITEKLLQLASVIDTSTRISDSFLRQELTRYFQESSAAEAFPAGLSSLKNNRFYFFIAAQTIPFTLDMQRAANDISASADYLSATLSKQENISIPLRFTNGKFLLFAVRIESSSQERNFLRTSITRQLWQRFSSSSNQPCSLFFYPHRINIDAFRKLFKSAVPLLHYYSIFGIPKPVDLEKLMEKENYLPLNRAFAFHTLDISLEHMEEQILKMRDYLMQCAARRDLLAIMDFYRSFCTSMENISHGHFSANDSQYFYTIEAFMKWVFNTYQDCITMRYEEHAGQFSPAVRTALEYMKENYANYTLNAEMIAEQVHLSSGRLGVLFKQETHRTINEYLTAIRIEQAIYFLKNTNLKIYEISEKCGYRSSQYFSQVFCTHTGKRPIDYRKT